MPQFSNRLKEIKYNVLNRFQNKNPETLRKISSIFSYPIHIMLLNTDGNLNIGMSIRSAVLFGVEKIYIVGRKRYDARPEVGAKNYVTIEKHDSVEPTIFFEENKLLPIFIEQGGLELETFNFNPYFINNRDREYKPCFIFGSESDGVPKEWMELLSAPTLSITQTGILRSLNLSIATSIVLYEYTKQKRVYEFGRI